MPNKYLKGFICMVRVETMGWVGVRIGTYGTTTIEVEGVKEIPLTT
jgi:hypothetical protein